MKSCLLLFVSYLAVSSNIAQADTILFESATLGPTGIPISELLSQNVPGTNISASVFAGVRFQLDQPVITSQVGGHFVANSGGNFFGAIVALEDEDDFPDSGDFSASDVLGATLLTFPETSNEVFSDLEILLNLGHYALVFDSGLFGANGLGVAVRNGEAIGSPTYIGGSPNTPGVWSDFTTIHKGNRYVLHGRIVSEPSTLTLASSISLFSYFHHRHSSRRGTS